MPTSLRMTRANELFPEHGGCAAPWTRRASGRWHSRAALSHPIPRTCATPEQRLACGMPSFLSVRAPALHPSALHPSALHPSALHPSALHPSARLASALVATVLAATALLGCGTSHGPDDAGADGGGRDAGEARDAGPGLDAGAPADGGGDAGERDASVGTCGAMDARRIACPELLCDGIDLWYWSGDRCFSLDCGACEGADCDRGFVSEADCRAEHAECDASLCQASGGEWLFWGEECGHFVCGVAPPQICVIGVPVCDCGPEQLFVPGVGCQFDVSCTMRPGGTREELCLMSGGTWEPICCDTECGEYCPLPCTSMACNCGPGRVYEDGRGCVQATRCYERAATESCGLPGARCEDGTICCDRCGGAGCEGRPTCRPPVCSDVPEIDECGNNRAAP